MSSFRGSRRGGTKAITSAASSAQNRRRHERNRKRRPKSEVGQKHHRMPRWCCSEATAFRFSRLGSIFGRNMGDGPISAKRECVVMSIMASRDADGGKFARQATTRGGDDGMPRAMPSGAPPQEGCRFSATISSVLSKKTCYCCVSTSSGLILPSAYKNAKRRDQLDGRRPATMGWPVAPIMIIISFVDSH